MPASCPQTRQVTESGEQMPRSTTQPAFRDSPDPWGTPFPGSVTVSDLDEGTGCPLSPPHGPSAHVQRGLGLSHSPAESSWRSRSSADMLGSWCFRKLQWLFVPVPPGCISGVLLCMWGRRPSSCGFLNRRQARGLGLWAESPLQEGVQMLGWNFLGKCKSAAKNFSVSGVCYCKLLV